MKNLSKNQTSGHLIAPMTELINNILNFKVDVEVLPFSIADICNLYFYEDSNGNRYSPELMDLRLGEIEAELNEVYRLLAVYPEDVELLYRGYCLEMETVEQHALTYEVKKIKEWWLVSKVFGRYLLLLKQPVLIYESNYFWGITID